MKLRIFHIMMLFFSIWLTAPAQISYTGDALLVNRVKCPYKPYRFNVYGYNGVMWTAPGGNYLKIDLRTDTTRISGSNDCVNFYDADNNYYTGVFVGRIENVSDSCAKTDVKPLESSRIMDLRPVTFNWRDPVPDLSSAQTEDNAGGTPHYGFIAQELREVYPELVREDDTGNLMVNYIGLVPVLVKSLQELEAKIDMQTEEIDGLLLEQSIYANTGEVSAAKESEP